MDATRLAALVRPLSAMRSRRRALPLGVGAALAGVLGRLDAEAKKRKKKRKKHKHKKRAPVLPPPPPPFARVACPGPFANDSFGFRRFAQTFVATGTGTLTTAAVEFGSLTNGIDLAFEIRAVDASGTPTGTILGTALLLDQPGASATTTVPATFAPPVPVRVGTTYALAVTDVSSVGMSVHLRTGDDCAGAFFFDPVANGTFTPVADRDLIFAVAP